ncbi:MAG: hypothetical protein EPN73_23265 [Paraburkholderia sp.]|nr:MAG: hypothetical protein EPN73_23265 [Paraburkholderia sp.]
MSTEVVADRFARSLRPVSLASSGRRATCIQKINRDSIAKCAQTGPHGVRFRGQQIRGNILAKSTMRGNREAKKPKQPKKVISPAAGVSPASAPKTVAASTPPRKK